MRVFGRSLSATQAPPGLNQQGVPHSLHGWGAHSILAAASDLIDLIKCSEGRVYPGWRPQSGKMSMDHSASVVVRWLLLVTPGDGQGLR